MTNVHIREVEGGQELSPALTHAIEIDTGTESKWTLFSALQALFQTAYDLLYVTATGTTTFTNKRITKRPVTVTQAAAPAINTDNGDLFVITGLAQAITSLTTNLTGTPTNGQMMIMEITDDGTGRAITPGASFVGTSNNTLTGLTTTANKTLILLWEYSTALSKWRLLGKDSDL